MGHNKSSRKRSRTGSAEARPGRLSPAVFHGSAIRRHLPGRGCAVHDLFPSQRTGMVACASIAPAAPYMVVPILPGRLHVCLRFGIRPDPRCHASAGRLRHRLRRGWRHADRRRDENHHNPGHDSLHRWCRADGATKSPYFPERPPVSSGASTAATAPRQRQSRRNAACMIDTRR